MKKESPPHTKQVNKKKIKTEQNKSMTGKREGTKQHNKQTNKKKIPTWNLTPFFFFSAALHRTGHSCLGRVTTTHCKQNNDSNVTERKKCRIILSTCPFLRASLRLAFSVLKSKIKCSAPQCLW